MRYLTVDERGGKVVVSITSITELGAFANSAPPIEMPLELGDELLKRVSSAMATLLYWEERQRRSAEVMRDAPWRDPQVGGH